ncbi:hypothetical protein [Brevundimonas sp. GCM10030266]|uniref:hypothetical protein n=1 Tax=Brevundimonas sp. GCM10030266 TaxID=3273386 RepID=UPI003605B193
MTDQPTVGVALKPCPFDEGSAIIVVKPLGDGWPDLFQGQCQSCGAESAPCNSDADAVTAWNTRTPASGAVEAARKIGRWIDAGMPDHSDDTPTREALKRDLRAVLAALTSEPEAEGADMRPVEATWSTGDSHAYVNMAAALSAEAMPWRKKIGLRITSFRFLDFDAPQPLQGGEVTREAAQDIRFLEAMAVDLDYAAMPTKPDVVTLCGSQAARTRDAIRTALALISPARTGGKQ